MTYVDRNKVRDHKFGLVLNRKERNALRYLAKENDRSEADMIRSLIKEEAKRLSLWEKDEAPTSL